MTASMNTHPLPADDADPARIRVGVSTCLLGERVRYDGGHKHDRLVSETLARHVELVPFCPEVAIGLGVPRPPIRLEGRSDAPRAVVIESGRDVTAPLAEYGRRIGERAGGLSGYVFKSRSPSCGVEGVAIHGGGAAGGRGVYARALLAAQPLLPAEEEIALGDPQVLARFLVRVRAYHRWQCLMNDANAITAEALEAYHAEHAPLVADDPEAARALRHIASRAGEAPDAAARDYVGRLLESLARRQVP